MNDDHPITPYERRRPPAADREWEYADPGPDPHFEVEESESIPWRRYLAALLRYKWLIALALLAGMGGSYFAWNSVQPSYIAQGSLWIRAEEGQREQSQGPIASGGLLDSRAWVELLNSFAVLDSVVRQEKLYLRPARPQDLELFEDFELDVEFSPGSYELTIPEGGERARLVRDEGVVDEATPGGIIGTPVGIRWRLPESGLPRDREVGFSVVTPRDAAIQLREQLQTQIDQQGNFLRVELRGTSPSRIARVLNAVMERHVELSASLKSGNLQERTQALQEQLANVEEELRSAERNLEEFRVQTITLPSDGSTPVQPGLEMTRDPVFSNYFQMQTELETLRRQRQRLQDILDQAAQGDLPLEMLQLIPAAQSSTELQEAIESLRTARSERRTLLQRYTTDHPDVQELTQTTGELEGDIIPELLQELIQGLGVEEDILASRVDSAGSQLSDIPPRTIEEARLRRRVAIAEQLYQNVRSRYETSTLAEASTIPDVRVLDRAAVPDVPTNDQRMTLAGMILGGALGLGILAAIFLDRFDPRVRYPDDVERRFGLPFLGVIPTIPATNGKKHHGGTRQAYEAFRELRTNLTYAYGAAGPLILAVTSPGKGEGKSLIAANLAMAFAQLGRKTLLIDGDTRRGFLHRTLGVSRKPGLTDFLAEDLGVDDLSRIERKTGHESLWLISSGSRFANSPELLSSGALSEAMADFKSRYDVIVMDTPPLGAGSDAALLSCVTGHLLLVLRSGTTSKELTQTKLDPLRRLPVRILGVVLNDYSPRGVGAYTYYGSYLPGYEAGREELDEDAEVDGRKKLELPAGSG